MNAEISQVWVLFVAFSKDPSWKEPSVFDVDGCDLFLDGWVLSNSVLCNSESERLTRKVVFNHCSFSPYLERWFLIWHNLATIFLYVNVFKVFKPRRTRLTFRPPLGYWTKRFSSLWEEKCSVDEGPGTSQKKPHQSIIEFPKEPCPINVEDLGRGSQTWGPTSPSTTNG